MNREIHVPLRESLEVILPGYSTHYLPSGRDIPLPLFTYQCRGL